MIKNYLQFSELIKESEEISVSGKGIFASFLIAVVRLYKISIISGIALKYPIGLNTSLAISNSAGFKFSIVVYPIYSHILFAKAPVEQLPVWPIL